MEHQEKRKTYENNGLKPNQALTKSFEHQNEG
jgi:hypothetical protein